MISEQGASLSPGGYVGIPLLILAALAAIVCIVLAVKNLDDWGPIWAMYAIAALGALGLGTLVYYPFSSDFHKYYPVTGTVQEIDKRLISTGDSGMSERFAVKLAPSGQAFAIDDTRASMLKPGDSVQLRCKREFELNSVPGWACKWNAR